MEDSSHRTARCVAILSEHYQDILPLLGSRQVRHSHYSLFDVPAVLLPTSKFILASRRIQPSDFERGRSCSGGTGHSTDRSWKLTHSSLSCLCPMNCTFAPSELNLENPFKRHASIKITVLC
ncbi:hypothetical protein ARMSODRAFT_130324 [Armillaria solidipes]|uniref:Uncharacterized protein n=1 Tax=Armillaria solidipes TaxID=1076256 RepID=A0A2H3C254_9AGAR|nr:hypothetical protein ARMSODRAFT_130324 [Armillaria solidipes]